MSPRTTRIIAEAVRLFTLARPVASSSSHRAGQEIEPASKQAERKRAAAGLRADGKSSAKTEFKPFKIGPVGRRCAR
jgi:hypothetical protein